MRSGEVEWGRGREGTEMGGKGWEKAKEVGGHKESNAHEKIKGRGKG